MSVDDVLAKGRTARLKEFFKAFGDKFECKPPRYLSPTEPLTYLSHQITMGWTNGKKWYNISQQRDVEKFLEDAGVNAAKPVDCPMPVKTALTSDQRLLSEQLSDAFESETP